MKAHLQVNVKSTSNIYITTALISLFLTLLLGILLRLGLGGAPLSFIMQFNLRQAHTHLGFYGFLFPLIWALGQQKHMWTPGKILMVLYILLVFISVLVFANNGYDFVSRLTSTLVLMVWLTFAIKNFSRFSPFQKGWLTAAPFSICLSVVWVSLVAVSASNGNFELSQSFVRGFLTTLSFGVFVPFAMEQTNFQEGPRGVYWAIATLGFAIFEMGEIVPFFFSLAPVALGCTLAKFVFVREKCGHTANKRMSTYWMFLAISLCLRGFGLIPSTHAISIAGIHFLMLGPLLNSFFSFKNRGLRVAYDFAFFGMICALLAMEYWPHLNLFLQFSAGISGVVLLSVLMATTWTTRTT